MSTYGGTLASFNPFSYEINKGADDFTAYDASIHWRSTDLPGSGSNAFDLRIQLSQPFLYDPASGPLLVNYRSFGPFASSMSADAHVTADATVGWIAASGTIVGGNLVTQFDVTAVPEPSAMMMFLLGNAVFFVHRRRL